VTAADRDLTAETTWIQEAFTRSLKLKAATRIVENNALKTSADTATWRSDKEVSLIHMKSSRAIQTYVDEMVTEMLAAIRKLGDEGKTMRYEYRFTLGAPNTSTRTQLWRVEMNKFDTIPPKDFPMLE